MPLFAETPIRDVFAPAVVPSQDEFEASFDNGYVYCVTTNRKFLRVFSPDGAFLFSTNLKGDKPAIPDIENLGVDTDGSVAVAWSMDGARGGFDVLDATGWPVRSVDTGPYFPAFLAYDKDHALWVFGFQENTLDYMTVRKYNSAGKMLGAYLPRSTFQPGINPASWAWGLRKIYIGSDRIGVWGISGTASGRSEWVDLDFKGTIKGRWRLDLPGVWQVGMTSDNRVYAETIFGSEHGLFLLDRASSQWTPVGIPSPLRLLGVQDNLLVFIRQWPDGPCLQWFAPPVN